MDCKCDACDLLLNIVNIDKKGHREVLKFKFICSH